MMDLVLCKEQLLSAKNKDGEVQLFSGRAKISNTRDRRSLQRLVKENRRKSVQHLTSMFNEGPKKISDSTMRKKLKEMCLRSCVSTGKPECDSFFDRVVYEGRNKNGGPTE